MPHVALDPSTLPALPLEAMRKRHRLIDPPPALPNQNEVSSSSLENFASEGVDAVEAVEAAEVEAEVASALEPKTKKRRISRKLTARIFVDPVSDQGASDTDLGKAYCRLGCLNKDGTDRKILTVTSTSLIERHLEAKHPTIFANF